MEATRTDKTARSGSHDAPGGATAPAAAPRFGDVSPRSDAACRLVPLRGANLDGFMAVRPRVPRVSFERPLPVAPVPPAAAAARAVPSVLPTASALSTTPLRHREGVSGWCGGDSSCSPRRTHRVTPLKTRARPTCPPPPTGDKDGDDDTLALASQPDTDDHATDAAKVYGDARAKPLLT